MIAGSAGVGPLRVGIIGSDMKHAFEYASVISPPDGAQHALTRLEPLDPRMEARVASVRCSAAAVDPGPISLRSAVEKDPAFQDAEVVTWYGPDDQLVRDWCDRLGVPHVSSSVEEVAELCDAVIVSTYHGEDHRELVVPLLEAGIPTFVDKPFATTVSDALAMVQAADGSGTTLFASSPWKWSPAIQGLKSELPRLGEIRTLTVSGPGINGPFFYVTHLVEIVTYLLGHDVEVVSCQSNESVHLITGRFPDRRVFVVNAMRGTAWMRHIVAYGEEGYLEADITQADRDEGELRTVVEFIHAVRNGSAPTPSEELVPRTAIMVAADESARSGGSPVPLAGVLP